MKHIDVGSVYRCRPRRGSPTEICLAPTRRDRDLWPKAPTTLVYRRLGTFMMVFFRPTVPREGCYHKVACSSKVANTGFASKADALALARGFSLSLIEKAA
jgi:hypothetical protein